MRTPIAYGLAAAAALVVAVVGFNLLPKNPSVGGPATATPTPTATSARPSPSPASTVVDASAFGVPLTLTVSGGYTTYAIERTNLGISWAGNRADTGFHPLSAVTLPGATGLDPWIPVPADFVAWIKVQPEYTAIQTRPVSVGGRSGTEVDADIVWNVDSIPRDLIRYTTGAWLYDAGDEGNRIRFIIVPGPSSSDGFMIVLNAKAADFDAATAALDVVLATVQFHAPTASPSR